MKRRYDRILCSTEGPMGFAALYLKKLYSVKTYFYLHTDWIMFARQVMGMEEAGLKRFKELCGFIITSLIIFLCSIQTSKSGSQVIQ